jgi:hypothetical protein
MCRARKKGMFFKFLLFENVEETRGQKGAKLDSTLLMLSEKTLKSLNLFTEVV